MRAAVVILQAVQTQATFESQAPACIATGVRAGLAFSYCCATVQSARVAEFTRYTLETESKVGAISRRAVKPIGAALANGAGCSKGNNSNATTVNVGLATISDIVRVAGTQGIRAAKAGAGTV